jgi:hypothetical protein
MRSYTYDVRTYTKNETTATNQAKKETDAIVPVLDDRDHEFKHTGNCEIYNIYIQTSTSKRMLPP